MLRIFGHSAVRSILVEERKEGVFRIGNNLNKGIAK